MTLEQIIFILNIVLIILLIINGYLLLSNRKRLKKIEEEVKILWVLEKKLIK